MASDPERKPATEDTAALDGDEPTVPDGDWPVSDLYYVDSDDAAVGDEHDNEAVATVVTAPGPPPRRGFPRNAAPAALAVLALAGAILLGAVLLGIGDNDPAATAQAPTESTTTAPPPETTSTVPAAPSKVDVADVEGMSVSEAEGVLAEQGLKVRLTRSPSPRPRGEILNQEPSPGSRIAKGTVVALVVSEGSSGGGSRPSPETVSVPGVVGLSKSDAVAAIRNAGLKARVRVVFSEQRRGSVVDQQPAERTELPSDSTVRIDVAKPRPATVQRIEVPDVVGTAAAAARSELRAAGLTVETVGVVSQEAAGTVISQSPSAGTEVRKGTRVRLSVSTGPARLSVPDVMGLDEASARRELERARFQVQVTDESVTDLAQDGMVLRQFPTAGSRAEDGAVVTIVVGRAG
jgi:beta-lactam-binding protein with PASTA domain